MNRFLFQHYWIILLVAFIVYIMCSLTIYCCQAPRKIYPVNLIMFMLLVESMTIIVCVSVIVYDRESILLALLSTVGIFFVILLISLVFKIDFTTCTGVLCVLFAILLTFSIGLLVAQFFMDITLLSVIYSLLTVCVISFVSLTF